MSDQMGYEGMENASREEILSAIFANMIVQNANMALIFMGRIPHPETGEIIRDLDSAQMFVDQLEALAAKTKGNLSPQEQKLMNQSLTAVRMAFVDATGGRASRPEAVTDPEPEIEESASEEQESVVAAPDPKPSAPVVESSKTDATKEPPDESRKRFVKKY